MRVRGSGDACRGRIGVIARGVIEALQAALEQFSAVAAKLGEDA